MKVLPGAFFTEFAGSIQGITVQNGRYGFIARKKPIPSKTRSASQSLIQGQFQLLTHGWSASLTQPQRDQWIAQTANWPQIDQFGVEYFLTGHQLYIKLNLNRFLTFQIPLTVAPIPSPAPTITTLGFTASEVGGTFLVDFTPTPLTGTSTLLLLATSPLPNGIKNFQSRLRFVGIIPGGSDSGFDMQALYVTKFGFAPISGNNVGIEVRPVITAKGQQGVPFSFFGQIGI